MLYQTVIIVCSVFTRISCVYEGEFLVEFATFHGIDNAVIVKEEDSGVFRFVLGSWSRWLVCTICDAVCKQRGPLLVQRPFIFNLSLFIFYA